MLVLQARGPGSNGNEGVLHIPQRFTIRLFNVITGSLIVGGGSYSSAEIAYSPTLTIWAKNKMRILPSCNSVSTFVWLQNLDFNNTLKKNNNKNFKKKQKEVVSCFDQILEIAAVQPLITHLTNHPSKTRWALLGK